MTSRLMFGVWESKLARCTYVGSARERVLFTSDSLGSSGVYVYVLRGKVRDCWF